MEKKKNPHCEAGIMQNCRDSEEPRSHFPVLFLTPDEPGPPEPAHSTRVFAPGVFASLPCSEAIPHRQMSPRRLRRRRQMSGSREYSEATMLL